jgi:hypothetical protein
MKVYPHTQPNMSHGTMTNQKTNEDFNKEKPNPKDPNQQKHHPETNVPEVGNNAETQIKPPKPPKTNDGR